MGKIHSIIRLIVGYCCQNFAMHVLSENYITKRRLMRNTFDVGRVTVQEYYAHILRQFWKITYFDTF